MLKTYEAERRPVANLAVEQAYTRYVVRTDPSLGATQCQPLVNDLNIEIGYVYRSNAIVPDAPDDGMTHLNPRESHGRPGTRAPHLWLTKDGQRISTLDLYHGDFVLLAGPEAHAWRQCAQAASGVLGSSLTVAQPGCEDLEDPTGSLCATHDIEPDGCVLVRPDGFVGWRARSSRGASPERLKSVFDQILGRS